MMLGIIFLSLICASFVMISAFTQSRSEAIMANLSFWTIALILVYSMIGGF